VSATQARRRNKIHRLPVMQKRKARCRMPAALDN
jgi:hypothetical protein